MTNSLCSAVLKNARLSSAEAWVSAVSPVGQIPPWNGNFDMLFPIGFCGGKSVAVSELPVGVCVRCVMVEMRGDNAQGLDCDWRFCSNVGSTYLEPWTILVSNARFQVGQNFDSLHEPKDSAETPRDG